MNQKEGITTFIRLVLRLVPAALIFLIYFTLWRPLRIAAAEEIIYSRLKTLQPPDPSYVMLTGEEALLIYYSYKKIPKRLEYRPQFGFFFLLAVAGFILGGGKFRSYRLLLLLHSSATVVGYLGLVAGVSGISSGFIITDFTGSYLTPALSLALIPGSFKAKNTVRGVVQEKTV